MTSLRSRPASRDLAISMAILVLASSLGGCHKVLFPKKEPRSQFENYDNMRQKYVPMEVPDVFGKPQPALRQRLQSS
ncbi:MAG: hypothetical protein ACO38W_11920 [Phycisphaerales bacterium]|jgi:hypothetical protein